MAEYIYVSTFNSICVISYYKLVMQSNIDFLRVYLHVFEYIMLLLVYQERKNAKETITSIPNVISLFYITQ